MKISASILMLYLLLMATSVNAQPFEKDSFVTKNGQLDITFIKHGSLLFTYNGNTIYIDPVAAYADYSQLPKADVILITHEHTDHFDPKAIADLKKESTILVLNPATQQLLGEGVAMKNGDGQRLTPYLYVEAVPAYNIEQEPEARKLAIDSLLIFDELGKEAEPKKKDRKPAMGMHGRAPAPNQNAPRRGEGLPPPHNRAGSPKAAATTPKREIRHPRHRDNGYVLTIDGKRIYVAGDTEDITEMVELKDIDIAFLPVSQPYTMTPKQAARAALMFSPTILYPYHYGATRIEELQDLLYYDKNIEVRIRQLQ